MATITASAPGTPVLAPALVLSYGYTRGSRNVIIELLDSEYPAVFLRPAQSKSGTLSLLFTSNDSAREAAAVLGNPDRFQFTEPSAGETWDFVVAGEITNTKVEGIDYWTVTAVFREVAPL